MSEAPAPGYYLATFEGGDEIVEVVELMPGEFNVLRMGTDAVYDLDDRFRIGQLVAMTVTAS